MSAFSDKIEAFAKQLEIEQIARLHQNGLACDGNIRNAKTSVKKGSKYWKVDMGTSGKYMVEVETGIIYGIKAYGQVHKGHAYGTLDTTGDWSWGDFHGVRWNHTREVGE